MLKPTNFDVSEVFKVDYDSAKMDIQLPHEKESSVKLMFFCVITLKNGHSFRHAMPLISEQKVSVLTDKVHNHLLVNQNSVNMEHWVYYHYSSVDASPVLHAYIKSLESETEIAA